MRDFFIVLGISLLVASLSYGDKIFIPKETKTEKLKMEYPYLKITKTEYCDEKNDIYHMISDGEATYIDGKLHFKYSFIKVTNDICDYDKLLNKKVVKSLTNSIGMFFAILSLTASILTFLYVMFSRCGQSRKR